MEQHPVPQNVTTFQFRLIGDMTIKQFGYLCGGGILALIAYKLPLPFFFTWPLAFAFGFLGVGFAFIPVEERPMDVWVFSFFKSIYSPTQYVWSREEKKQAAPPAIAPTVMPPVAAPQPKAPAPATTPVTPPPATKNTAALSQLFTPQAPVAAPAPAVPHHVVSMHPKRTWVDEFLSIFRTTKSHTPAAVPVPTRAPTTPPMPSVTGVHPAPELSVPPKVIPKVQESREAEQKMAHLEDKLKTLQTELHTKTMTEDRILELQKQLTDLLSEKSTMQDELTKLRRQMDNAAQTAPQPVTPAAQPSAAKPGQPTVSVITSRDAAVKVGLPRLTNVPNVPTGIIKDDANNLLPGILVTVTNSESMPMRAFKTNKLGQFGASTPLPNGTYLVEIEDPRGRFTFDRAQITLNNVVLPPLEIIAKSQKQLTREKLAQEIFGGGMQ